MTREEFKQQLNDLIDNLVPEGELTESNEESLIDLLGETASDIIDAEEPDEEKDEKSN